jgi:5-methylcytosine-specific restriction endonuclease McrA
VTRADHKRRPGRSSKWISRCARLAIYLRDSYSCCYCGRDLKDAAANEVSLDHLVCRQDRINHDPTNLITACFRCNRARGTKPWKSYATAGAVERITRLRRRRLNLALARQVLKGDIPLVEVLTKQAQGRP